MNPPIRILAVVLLTASAYSAEMPPELAAVKARYQTALNAGSKPAREQYLQELQKLKGSPKTKKNTVLAAAIAAEIKSLNSDAASLKQTQGEGLPYGKTVPGRPGFVTSPYEPYKGYIDVQGYSAGTKIICPYSQKPFLVPELSK